jgi:catechol 2,3-dioxygenase-like lactoylglutathione lyase family enzyme
MNPVSFGYVILYVQDVAAALAFYQEAFGFSQRFFHDDNGMALWGARNRRHAPGVREPRVGQGPLETGCCGRLAGQDSSRCGDCVRHAGCSRDLRPRGESRRHP